MSYLFSEFSSPVDNLDTFDSYTNSVDKKKTNKQTNKPNKINKPLQEEIIMRKRLAASTLIAIMMFTQGAAFAAKDVNFGDVENRQELESIINKIDKQDLRDLQVKYRTGKLTEDDMRKVLESANR